MIKFLGPRNKLNKSIGAYASSASSHGAASTPASASAASSSSSNKKALSANCDVEFADYPADRWARLTLSQQEQDVINAGTNEVDIDWKKIRL